MALALENSQAELHPLEVGLHALRSGLSVREYAEKTGLKSSSVSDRRRAAEVASECTHMRTDRLPDYWRHLAEIHAAPQWAWGALVGNQTGTGSPLSLW
jgi:hypothetical protein